MDTRISRAIMTLAAAASFATASPAFAQVSVTGSNLQVKKVFVKTKMTPTTIYSLDNLGSYLFGTESAIKVNCPKPGGNCLLQIDVTVQASVAGGETLFIYARADYHDGISPAAQVMTAPPG